MMSGLASLVSMMIFKKAKGKYKIIKGNFENITRSCAVCCELDKKEMTKDFLIFIET